MAEQAPPQQATVPAELEAGTYEIIRGRLGAHGGELRQRLQKLNAARKEVFGSVESALVGSERVTTDNNCVPRDIIPIGNRCILGYNVFIGLRSETSLADVFAVYEWKDDGKFSPCSLELIGDQRFQADFRNLYRYYRNTTFAKFAIIGPHLFMVFQVGKDPSDVKTFKWLIRGPNLEYVDNRSDHECVFPPQQEFEWKRVTHDMHRSGAFPHVSIEDRVFVETMHGDLTVKIEDNTATGEGIYREPVENADQTLDDAEMYYAVVGNVILLRIRPYKESRFRHVVYNEKVRQARRIDSIADACILLPDGQGLIFPKGYYLQTGQMKLFELDCQDLAYEKRFASPNGEDFLYMFYNRQQGVYVLLPYNLIEQKVGTPIVCNGFSLFDDGTMLHFRAEQEPQKHHVVQVWRTPFCGADHKHAVNHESYLYKIGNRDIVRCMAECNEMLGLLDKEDTYANLYVDIARKAQDIRDSYFWLDSPHTFRLAEPLEQIANAASSAIEEYEKVVRARLAAREAIGKAAGAVRELISSIDYYRLDEIGKFVSHLMGLRALRGEAISLRELRYADLELIASLEAELTSHADKLSGLCVDFLLKPQALEPYRQRVSELATQVPALGRLAQAKELQDRLAEASGELEMLIEVVSNLNIADATQTTAIVDSISLALSQINQVKSAAANRGRELGAAEGQAEFAAQMKLIDQTSVNYLDVCDSPQKCDEYLTKVMASMESLESRFAAFEDFVVRLSEKREELYNAFESRKVAMVEQRARRASGLMTAAQRMLKGIRSRSQGLATINDINGYFASDLMIERLRETIRQLMDLGDVVKAEDVSSQLKSIQQDAVRQLKDRQALYEDGQDVIRLGRHRFSVNRHPLELTIVQREGGMFFHLTGTGFFEPVADEAFLATRDVWALETLSESPQVYRAEYLAYLMLQELTDAQVEQIMVGPPEETLRRVQLFTAGRYAEGYVKGVHDHDAAVILRALAEMKSTIGLLRYPTDARALAGVFWQLWDEQPRKGLLAARAAGVGHMRQLFKASSAGPAYVDELRDALRQFVDRTRLFAAELIDDAAEYLFCELAGGGAFVISQAAAELRGTFEAHLRHNRFAERFAESARAAAADPAGAFCLLRDWLRSYAAERGDGFDAEYADEAAAAMLDGQSHARPVLGASIVRELTGLVGSHGRIEGGACRLDYCDFMRRLGRHHGQVAPRFRQYQQLKKELIDGFADRLRLSEFQPAVLTTFVRNRLIDRVYLPLIGDNLAKQVGAAGDAKRTDRQGLLLLISPPGYGKTTLMEYVANRLGLIFMKVNGPAIGSRVTSLDPAEATNAAARQELCKLNLAFEMGDNVMIYVDDIQHCHPEFLQKFISLCDAQRRVEGVYGGRTRTYDLRGKRVCVVMAGNPYTESGEKFKIPDMLANRSDTYNIGDIVGDNYEDFVNSYIENCLTSNPVLARLANRSQDDVYAVMKLADGAGQEAVQFEGSYAPDELNEYVATMRKLFTVRQVVLTVNQQYIRSAAQADEYRTEPPFLLQGSYRNMNRIASRVLPVMNDQELWTLIQSAYEQDAQTLATGAEASLLKFKELTGRLCAAEAARWKEIKKTYNRNKLLGAATDDRVGTIIRQLNAFSAGLDSIKDVLSQGVLAVADARGQQRQDAAGQLKHLADEVLKGMSEIVATLKQQKASADAAGDARAAQKASRDAQTLVSVLEEQFAAMETWLAPVVRNEQARGEYVEGLVRRFEAMVAGYGRLIEVLRDKRKAQGAFEDIQLRPPAEPKAPRRRKGASASDGPAPDKPD